MVKEFEELELLQSLGKGLKDVLEELPGDKIDSISDSGVFLFFSFDLSDSTAFKNEHLSLWSVVFTCFYGKILECLGVENYKTPNSNYDDSKCVRRLWKLNGDEVLIYVYINDYDQLYNQVKNIGSTLTGLIDIIAGDVEKFIERNDGLCKAQCHCQDIKDVIKSTLGIKVTAWIAECYQNTPINTTNAPNIVYSPVTTMGEKGIDFLGRDIDEGFRIAKYAVKNKIIISPLLAWLIWKTGEEDQDQKKIIESNFKITAFIKMKGVWRSRKVPIIMYNQEFKTLIKCLEYDELDSPAYCNVTESGLDNFFKDERFNISRIDSIFEDVHRKKEAEKLYEKLKNIQDIEIPSSRSFIKRQEFHIACMIFDKDGKILIHNDNERGREFGCIKKIFGGSICSWKAICEEGYKDKYGIPVTVEECPKPVATYYYEKSNALGVIVMAEYAGTQEELSEKKEWEFFEISELEKTTEKAVACFMENIYTAVGLRGVTDERG